MSLEAFKVKISNNLCIFLDAPPPKGQWRARRTTGGYNTRHNIFAPWAGINEDLLYAHALATDHTWYGMVWTGTG